mgnify:CR=1 FL=1
MCCFFWGCSLIDLGVSDDVSKREVDIIAMSAMLGVAVLYYFALIMPMYWTHIKRQALSLRLFLAVPRAVVLRQYRQHRKSGFSCVIYSPTQEALLCVCVWGEGGGGGICRFDSSSLETRSSFH